MKLWVDDIRPAPTGYIWAKSVEQAKTMISFAQNGILIGLTDDIFLDVISLDHDAGEFVSDGGDYIEILNWLERVQNNFAWPLSCKFHLHSQNPVGVQNMRRIIQHNNWEEI